MAAGSLRERGVFQTGFYLGIAGKPVPMRRRHRGPAAGELSDPGGDNHAVRLLARVRQEAELWSAPSTNILPSVIRPEMLLSSFGHACASSLVRQDTRCGAAQESAFVTCPSFPGGGEQRRCWQL
jgi:hypothetical protein